MRSFPRDKRRGLLMLRAPRMSGVNLISFPASHHIRTVNRSRQPTAGDRKSKPRKVQCHSGRESYAVVSSKGSFRGRPRARNVDSKPRRFAVFSCQDSSPKGAPRRTDRRSAANPASVSGNWTCRRQSRGNGSGPSSKTAVLPMPCALKLPSSLQLVNIKDSRPLFWTV